jgi:hypothetical protein
MLAVITAAIGAAGLPQDAKADAPWGGSVAFKCKYGTYGSELVVVNTGVNGNQFKSWISINGAPWLLLNDWQGMSTTPYFISQHMNVTFYVQHRRWNGYAFAYHSEYGYVQQTFPGQNPVNRGYGQVCNL